MIAAVHRSALLCMMVACGHVLAYPYNGDNAQWSNPGAGMMTMNRRQQPGFGGGSVGQHRGFGGGGAGFGGQPRWQSAGYGGQQQQGAEAYQTNVFNEPDRYGYDYTMPGATVHFLMYKKRGNRIPGNNQYNQYSQNIQNNQNNENNHGVDSSGWDRRY